MNRLKQLRNEFCLTTRDVESLLGFSNASISYYENESRNMNVSIIISFSALYQVTIDYLLSQSENGLFVFYNERRYLIDDVHFNKYKKQGLISYINGKRLIDLNKKLQLNNDINVADLLDKLEVVNTLNKSFDGKNLCNIKIPQDRFEVINKIIQLNDEKFDAVSKMINLF